MLLGSMMPDIDAVLAELINEATRIDGSMVVVIDDVHVITDPEVHRALTFILDNSPSSLHVVLAGRDVPPLPVARYRARQELFELRADDLKFTPEECEVLLNRVMELDVESEEVAPLHARLEGWPAGLQLAALALRNRTTSAAELLIGGRHRMVADYLAEDVLARLSDDTRQFLLQTSILNGLTGALCDAVTARTDGQGMLESLERRNLFVSPLDDNREWFRYHRVFADFLREQLARQAPEELPELHRRAATWYLRNDLPDQTFDHARAANDMQLVVEVIDTYVQVKLFSGQVTILLQWLHAIPDEWFVREPLFILFRSVVNVATGQFDECVRCLDDVELAVRSSDQERPEVLARVTAMRCFVACFQNDLTQAEFFAEAALHSLVAADESFRGGVYGALGDTYRRNGHWAQAQEHYLLALDHSDNPEGFIQAVHAFGALADLELRQGKLKSAANYWRKAQERIGDQRLWGVYPLPLIGWVHIRLGEILYEWNDLEAAKEAAVRGREYAALGGDPRSIIAGGLLALRLHLAHGEFDAAAKVIDDLQPIVADAEFPDWSIEFERRRVDAWLATDKLRTAVNWADDDLASYVSREPDSEPLLMAIARVRVVQGNNDSTERALKLLDREIEAAVSTGRTSIEIAAHAIGAMALWNRGDRADALSSLERAMRLAEPEGYVRTFVDLGLPMARLLQEARGRNVMPGYVDRLLTAYGDTPLPHGSDIARLPEPLSDREREVLGKVAAGLTNREIADALFISPETVKKHTASIYGKLGVRSRLEAVTMSRELDLLG
jgi:LuxR family maltose regulon positive regulatory protein